jgi:hypothetical protein
VAHTGEMKFVHLLCKGDLRQWFEKLEPKDGMLGPVAVQDFVSSFCKSMSMDVPKDDVVDFLENVPEVKFHDFVLLAILITKPLRVMGRLELDEELLQDAEESTSEGSDSEDGDRKKEDVVDTSLAPPRPTRVRGSSFAAPAQSTLTRIKGRLRAGSVRKEGVLQYVNFVTKKDTLDWFLQLASSPDDAVPLGMLRPFFESLANSLRLKVRAAKKVCVVFFSLCFVW